MTTTEQTPEGSLPKRDSGTTQILEPNPDGIAQAAQLLNDGQLVAIPTETVYGLAGALHSAQAIAGIFKAKGRPSDHPLIAHVAGPDCLDGWADTSHPLFEPLVRAFWPGPLTLVLPKGEKTPLSVTGGQDTVAVRCPNHPVALEVLRRVRSPLAAPSANRFGKVSPTRADHVLQELDGRIAAVLEGGESEVGIESTILSLLGEKPMILRPGVVTAGQIAEIIHQPVGRSARLRKQLEEGAVSSSPYAPLAESESTSLGVPLKPSVSEHELVEVPRVSGALESHYSPNAQVRIYRGGGLGQMGDTLPEAGHVLCVGWGTAFVDRGLGLATQHSERITFRSLPNDPRVVAHELYCILREADEAGFVELWIEEPEHSEAWEGVLDRLKRASAES